ncbi:MAG: SulP family inorganic anion transporter [Wenzhouxiangellaceae bacterium]
MSQPSLSGDLFGGLTAAVVALPLALAFGVASGLGPLAGVYGAIAIGFFASAFGGTPAQISGPTGPMTVVTAAVVAQYAENLNMAFTIIMLGGVMQMLLGVLKVGKAIAYTPYSVISGFMSGIGIIIILLQLPALFGVPQVEGAAAAVLLQLDQLWHSLNLHALLVGLGTLLVALLWPARWQRWLPAPLAALIAGSLLANLLLTRAPVLGELPFGLPTLHWPGLQASQLTQAIQPAFVLALLGSIDSLLTSLVADSLTRTQHRPNRELLGQGLGNTIAGLVGGIPGAGATMRTVINIQAGGRGRTSGIVHAVTLLLLVLVLAPVTGKIPHAVLAGILLKVGWDIIDWGYLRVLLQLPRDKVLVMLITLILTVFVDLITAVAVGLIVAGIVTAMRTERDELSRVQAGSAAAVDDLSAAEQQLLAGSGDAIAILSMSGRFSYASARALNQRLALLDSQHRVLILDFGRLAYVDPSMALAIRDLLHAAADHRLHCVVVCPHQQALSPLQAFQVFARSHPDDIVTDRHAALTRAVQIINQTNQINLAH